MRSVQKITKKSFWKTSSLRNIGVLLLFQGILFSLVAQTSGDKIKYQQLINDSITEMVRVSSRQVWAVAGVNRQKVVRIWRNRRVREFLFDANHPNIYFTTLYALPNGAVLAGTKENFLFYFHRKSCVQIKRENGLADSTIYKIYTNQKTGKIELTTPNRIYVLENTGSARRIKCVEKRNEEPLIEIVSKTIRKNIRKPIQKGISMIASELDLSGRTKKYIGPKQLDSILKQLHPGDILLKRDNYYLSNVGIEGFWTHSAIYIGSLALLDSVFGDVPFLMYQKPSEYLAQNVPLVYHALYGKRDMIIEAIGQGVTINPIEHIAFVDYLAALRPNLQNEDCFKSLVTAFEYLGTPYDFLFDFSDDNEVVCSELIYNAFCGRSDKGGIPFLFGEVMGHPFVSPNDIAHQFANEMNGASPSFLFVFFCDIDKKSETPYFSTADAFSKSWKR
jgi:hypothetical protein